MSRVRISSSAPPSVLAAARAPLSGEPDRSGRSRTGLSCTAALHTRVTPAQVASSVTRGDSGTIDSYRSRFFPMRITPSRTTLRHPAAIAAAVLALTLAAVPFLPDGNDPQGSITPVRRGSSYAGPRRRDPRHARRDRARRRGRSNVWDEPTAGRPRPRRQRAARPSRASATASAWGGPTGRPTRSRRGCRSARRRGASRPGTSTATPSSPAPPVAASPPGSGRSAPS